MEKACDEINEKHRELKIKRRGITTYCPAVVNKYLNDEFLEKNNINLKEFARKDYKSNISIEIYGNFVQIFSHRYLQGILIQNNDIAETIGMIFEMVWKVVEDGYRVRDYGVDVAKRPLKK